MNEEEISQRIERLINRVHSELRPGLEEPIQNELAQLINMMPDIKKSADPQLIGATEVAISALLLEQPNIELATEIRKDIQRRVRPTDTLFTRMMVKFGGKSPSNMVIIGLGFLLYLAFPFAMSYGPSIVAQKEILGIDASMLLLVGLAGASGSIVSIMVRIQDFTPMTDVDPSVLFLTGFFKPVVGMFFALFIFAALSSGLIPVTIELGKERYFFIALSFVAGFSERFARDIVTKTEQKIAGK